MTRRAPLVLSLTSAFFLFGCSDGPKLNASPSLGAPTFTNLTANVLRPHCMRCHSTATPTHGVSTSSYEEVLSSTFAVTPFQPGQSPLYLMFKGEKLHEQAVRLTPAELELLYQWIALGAKND